MQAVPAKNPRTAPIKDESPEYQRYFEATEDPGTPIAFRVPMTVLSSLTMRVMVVIHTSAANRAKNTGKISPTALTVSISPSNVARLSFSALPRTYVSGLLRSSSSFRLSLYSLSPSASSFPASMSSSLASFSSASASSLAS